MANTLRLRYGELAKPVLADRDGEVDTNWVDGGTHVVTADATHVYSGTKSFKLAASGTGDFTTNYGSLASGNNGTFVVGKQYVLSIWTYSDADSVFQVKTGGVSLDAIQATSDWECFHLTFTAVTATTALQIIITAGGGTLWFELEPIQEYVELTVMSERGLTEPDSVEFYPPIQHRYLNGGMEDDVQAFRRKIRLDVGVVEAAADRRRILYWQIDSDRTFDYLTEINIPMCLEDVGGYDNEWKFDCSLMRYYTFDLLEPSVRTVWPI